MDFPNFPRRFQSQNHFLDLPPPPPQYFCFDFEKPGELLRFLYAKYFSNPKKTLRGGGLSPKTTRDVCLIPSRHGGIRGVSLWRGVPKPFCDLYVLWVQDFHFDFAFSMLRCSRGIAYLDLLSYITNRTRHPDAPVASTSYIVQVVPRTTKIF